MKKIVVIVLVLFIASNVSSSQTLDEGVNRSITFDNAASKAQAEISDCVKLGGLPRNPEGKILAELLETKKAFIYIGNIFYKNIIIIPYADKAIKPNLSINWLRSVKNVSVCVFET